MVLERLYSHNGQGHKQGHNTAHSCMTKKQQQETNNYQSCHFLTFYNDNN